MKKNEKKVKIFIRSLELFLSGEPEKTTRKKGLANHFAKVYLSKKTPL